jgi:hypothetical protein
VIALDSHFPNAGLALCQDDRRRIFPDRFYIAGATIEKHCGGVKKSTHAPIAALLAILAANRCEVSKILVHE